jgi:hypothetical protein
VREHEPFEWRPVESLKKKYEDPLKILSGLGMPVRQRIVLEFVREEEVNGFGDNQYEREKTKFRRIVVGSCKLLDNKLEKAGTYEIVPGVSYYLFNYILERCSVLRVRQLERIAWSRTRVCH